MRPFRPAAPRLGLALACVLVTLAGCGKAPTGPGVATPKGSTAGPHGFNAVPLGEGLGFAEVTTELAPGQSDPKLVVYFLGDDVKTPAAALPTEATVSIPGLSPAEFPLTSKQGRAESAPVPVDPDRIAGTISGTLAGKSFSVPFTVGQ